MMNYLGAGAIALILIAGLVMSSKANATETLAYVVQSTEDDIELRLYAPYIVAEVDVEAQNEREASSRGFRKLADYIFGGNVPREKIAMTAPVMAQEVKTSEKGQKIAMTAPVTAMEKQAGLFTVQFTMPSKWTMETLPVPKDDSVRLRQVAEHYKLAQTFRGEASLEDVQTGKTRLISFATQKEYEIDGTAIWAGYSSPAVPRPFRKWEIMLPVSLVKP